MIGERGAARFKSEDLMWKFMKSSKGNLQYKAMGNMIFARVD